MIERIAAQNFRRLKDCNIEIRDGITILSGPNGTGKSTVIEAACFCLYGKVKSGTKKDTIRRNNAAETQPTRTSVDFFIGDKHYRCVRALTAKGSTIASLYCYKEDDYKVLAEGGNPFEQNEKGTQLATAATGTTTAVAGLLGVDYDGFCASFISQQKELDALASLTPEARKKFFLELIGFSKLDDIKPELSRDARSIRQSIDLISKQNYDVKQINQEIQQTNEKIEELIQAINKGTLLLEPLKVEVETLSRDYYANESTAKRCQEMAERRAILSLQVAALTEKAEQARIQAESWSAPSWFNEEESAYDRLSQAREALSRVSKICNLTEEIQRLEGAALIREKKAAEKRARAESLREQTATVPDVEGAQTRAADAQVFTKETQRKLDSSRCSLASINDLLEKVNEGVGVVCPTCASTMSSQEGKAHLEKEKQLREEEIEGLEQELAEAQSSLKKAKEELENQKAKKRVYDSQLSNIASLEREAGELKETAAATRREDIEEKRKVKEELEGRALAEMQEEDGAEQAGSLSGTASADWSSNEVDRLGRQVKELEEIAGKEKEARAGLQAHRLAVSEQKEAEASLKALAEELARAEAFLAENGKAGEKALETAELLEKKKDKQEKFTERLVTREKEKAAKEAELSGLYDKLSKAKEQVETLSGLYSTESELKSAALVVEYLRKDLPSRIAPMLSQEASCIMETATDGAYSLLDIDEAYDVRVFADDAAMPLSQMSGGESDIIALSIRIAIAQMILEATGAQSQTMILDEIFGALDDGRKQSTCRALENLHSILPRILCVSHVDEIKEMADWSYVVEKDEDGDSVVREITDEVPL